MDKKSAIGLGAAVLLIGGLAFVAGNYLRPIAVPNGTGSRRDARADAPLPTDIPALCDRLVAAVRDKDADAAADLIDVPRMLRAIEEQKILGSLTPADHTAMQVALQAQVPSGFVQEGEAGAWQTCKVHHTNQRPGANEAVVVLRMLTKDGTHSSLMRFYVVKNQDAWALYDWEDVDRIYRTSTNLAMTLASQRGQIRGNYLQAIMSAARYSGEGNIALAERILSQLATVDLGEVLETTRWLLVAKIKIDQGQTANGLKALDLAAKLNPDIPSLTGLRAAAYQKQGDSAKAIALAKEAMDSLGPDAHMYAIEGTALLAQGKKQDALVAFHNGLGCDPNVIENLVGLVRIEPDDPKGEIGQYLAKMENVVAQFTAGAEELLAANDMAALAVLIARFQKQFPSEPAGDYFQGELSLRKKDYEAAGKAFAAAAARVRNDAQRQRVVQRLLDTWLLAGKPLEGYKLAPDADAAFGYVGEQLLAKKDEANLTRLAQLHGDKNPKDARVFYYRGQACLLAKRYGEAEKAFADGSTRATNDDLREVFRRERVNARFQMGEGLSAYGEIKPQRATFDQLARLFLDAKQADALRALVAAHRKNAPDAADLDSWDAEACVLKKEYGPAAKLFKSAGDRTSDADDKQALLDRALECWALSGNPAEGYRQSANGEHAFGVLGDRLLEKKNAKGLAQLVDARRKAAPNDIRLLFYQGQAMLLDAKPAEAEPLFAEGMKKADGESATDLFRQARIQALYKMGQAMRAYKEIAPQRQTFDILAHLYTDDKDAAGLQNLTAAHFKDDPEDASLGLWAAEARWLRQDYNGTVEVLTSKRDAILKDDANRDRLEDRLIRSLARLKRFDEALKLANESSSRDGDPWYEAVVLALAGEPKKAAEALDSCARRGYALKDFHDDPDIGPALRTGALGDLVKQYPPPAAGEK